MAENFTIKAIYNKDHYHPENWLKTRTCPCQFYVYEHGRWLCMLSRKNDSTYRIISYSVRVSATKFNTITSLIERRLQTIIPQDPGKAVFVK